MKRIFKRHWPGLIMAGMIGVVLLYLAGSLTGGGDESRPGGVAAGEGIRMKDIHYTQDDPDQGMKWILDAEVVTFSSDHSTMAFQDFRLRVEPEDKPWFQMQGRGGEYSRASGDIRLWGDLEGTSQNGYRLTTDELRINEKTREVRTDRPVVIAGPLFSVAGRGLFADLKGQRVEITEGVTTLLKQEAWAQ